VAENVALAIETGVSGLSIEDRKVEAVSELYSLEFSVARLQAARKAIDQANADVVLVARTEGLLIDRHAVTTAIDKLVAFAEAGADCLYAPGVRSKADILAMVRAVAPKPLNVLALEPYLKVAELADLGVVWLEEPLPAADLAGMRTLREQTGIRVAGGEMARTPDELLAALAAEALDVLQPDVVLSVGMLRARTLAELALQQGRWFTPHTWTNGLGVLANLHVAAGVGGGPYLEFPYDPPGWTPERRDFFLTEPVGIDAAGCIRVPAEPGLGAHIDADAVAKWRVA